MANNSKSYPTNPELREALAKLRAARKLTNKRLGLMFGVGETFISKYIGDKCDSNPAEFEATAWDIFKAIQARLDLAGLLMENSVSRAMAGRISIARRTGHCCLFGAAAGEGKSSGAKLYQKAHPSTLYFKMGGPERTADDVQNHLFALIRQSDWSPNLRRWPAMVAALTGSERAIICDNAHRLDTGGRNALFDFSEDTGCPVIFVGNPEILTQIRKNDQQFSRIGTYKELKLSDKDLPIMARAVAEQFSDAETADAIEDLASFVATQPGRLRAVKMDVILAQELRAKDAKLDPRAAFRKAHKQLVRDYDLPND